MYDNAMLTLQWNESHNVDPAALLDADRDSVPWAAVATSAAAGNVDQADQLIGRYLTSCGPVTWMTYGTLTMLAHIAAGLGTSRHARELLDRLKPVSHCIATIGHVAVVGPVALAVARLSLLLGDHEAAHRYLDVATGIADRGAGASALARCRSFADELTATERHRYIV